MLYVSQFGSPALGTTSSTDVSNLQTALTNAGQKRPVTGLIADGDIGALWTVLGADLAKAQQIANAISSSAGTALGWLVDAIQFVDSEVKKLPGGIITTAGVLSKWSTVAQVINAAASPTCYVVCAGGNLCDQATCESGVKTVGNALQAARTTTANGIASKAGMFASIVNAFSGHSTGSSGTKPSVKNQLLLPIQATQVYSPTSTGGGFPVGSVARYNTTRKVWSIYRPLNTGTSIGCPVIPDNGNGLGGPPAPPAGYTLYTTATSPGAAKIITPEEHDTAPWYKAWWFWTIVGVGAAGGGIYYYRRKRAHA